MPIVELYGTPTVPAGKDPVVRTRFGAEAFAETLMLKSPVALAPVASCACAVKLKLPWAEGVPDRVPVTASRARPVGREPVGMLQV